LTHRDWLLLLLISSSLAATPASAADGCATCDRLIVLAKKDAKCIDHRLEQQLAGTQDPILFPVGGCGASGRDGTRQEWVATPGRRNAGGDLPHQTYLLTRHDALCLRERLRSPTSTDKLLHFDLGDCPR
jgi:hypothetical protein